MKEVIKKLLCRHKNMEIVEKETFEIPSEFDILREHGITNPHARVVRQYVRTYRCPDCGSIVTKIYKTADR